MFVYYKYLEHDRRENFRHPRLFFERVNNIWMESIRVCGETADEQLRDCFVYFIPVILVGPTIFYYSVLEYDGNRIGGYKVGLFPKAFGNDAFGLQPFHYGSQRIVNDNRLIDARKTRS